MYPFPRWCRDIIYGGFVIFAIFGVIYGVISLGEGPELTFLMFVGLIGYIYVIYTAEKTLRQGGQNQEDE